MTVTEIRLRWPRVVRALEQHLNHLPPAFAARCVLKMKLGQPLYHDIVAEGLKARHGRKRAA